MGKPTGFMEYKRENDLEIAPLERIRNFEEFHVPLSLEKQQVQGARCMACGVPFCQAGMMIGGMASGCPLNNLVPECNDLVYHGNWEEAYRRLTKTHCFPEFTSRVCPALCEAACTCNLDTEPVATKANERAIIEHAYEVGLVKPCPPEVRTGKKVAVVGSGPSGLAAAMQLNKRGHKVTVYERNDRIGGLLRYGIPNMKLDKKVIDRRLAIMEAEGIEFVTNANIGENVKAEELLKQYDAVVLACGASNPRDIKAPGREAKGIYFAVDFLKATTKSLLDSDFADKKFISARGKARDRHRRRAIPETTVSARRSGLGAASVTQLEMMPKAPDTRAAGQSMAAVAESLQDGLRPAGSDRRVRARSAAVYDDCERVRHEQKGRALQGGAAEAGRQAGREDRPNDDGADRGQRGDSKGGSGADRGGLPRLAEICDGCI